MINNITIEAVEKWLAYEHKYDVWLLCGGKDRGDPPPAKNFGDFPAEEIMSTMEKIFLGKEATKMARSI